MQLLGNRFGVAAAGNQATCRPYFPAGLNEVKGIGAVGAGGRAWFSNWGGWVDACAPGVDVVSTFFDFSEDLALFPDLDELKPRAYKGWARWSGTSFSAPKVAAVLAQEMYLNLNDDWNRPDHGAGGMAPADNAQPPAHAGPRRRVQRVTAADKRVLHEYPGASRRTRRDPPAAADRRRRRLTGPARTRPTGQHRGRLHRRHHPSQEDPRTRGQGRRPQRRPRPHRGQEHGRAHGAPRCRCRRRRRVALATRRSQRRPRSLPRQRGPCRPQPRRLRCQLASSPVAGWRADRGVGPTVGGDDGDDAGEQGRADHHGPARRRPTCAARAARPRRSPTATRPRDRHRPEDDVERQGERSRTRLPAIAEATPTASSPAQELAIESRPSTPSTTRTSPTTIVPDCSTSRRVTARSSPESSGRPVPTPSSARPACCPASARAHSAGCGRRSGG